MSFGHGGHTRRLAHLAGCAPDELLDFSANINPLGPPDCLRRVIARNLSAVVHYPDPHCLELREALASRHGVPPECLVVGNGSTELLYALPRVLGLKRAVIPVPSYIDYVRAAELAGMAIETVELDAADGFAIDWRQIEQRLLGEELLIVGQPGNPTGTLFNPSDLTRLAERHPASMFVDDEAFADFAQGCPSLLAKDAIRRVRLSGLGDASQGTPLIRPGRLDGGIPAANTPGRRRPNQPRTGVEDGLHSLGNGHPNIIVVRTMTKFYAIPGLRLGYAVAAEPIARRLRAVLPPWSVGSLAQAVGVAVIEDSVYFENTRAEVTALREQLYQGLSCLEGVRVFPSAANYLLARLEGSEPDAPELARRLLKQNIAIRVCDNYIGLDRRYFRVAVRTQDENERLLNALACALAVPTPQILIKSAPAQTPAIMFQGTASNAGKSVLTSAFAESCCRTVTGWRRSKRRTCH